MRIVVRLLAVRPDSTVKKIFQLKSGEDKSLEDMRAVKDQIAARHPHPGLHWLMNDRGVIEFSAPQARLDAERVKFIRTDVEDALASI